jgi:hypothetical protein
LTRRQDSSFLSRGTTEKRVHCPPLVTIVMNLPVLYERTCIKKRNRRSEERIINERKEREGIGVHLYILNVTT